MLVLDARKLGGSIVAFHHEGMVSKENVLKLVEDRRPADVELYAFGGQLPIPTGYPIEPIH